MKKTIRYFSMIFCVLAIGFGFFAPSSVYADTDNTKLEARKITVPNENFSATISCGIDGLVMYDAPTSIRITLESATDFEGSILFFSSEQHSWRKQAGYEQTLSLAKGEAKTLTFTPSTMANNGSFVIRILDKKNTVVYEEKNKLSQIYHDGLLIGVLSENYNALNYLDRLSVVGNYMQGTTQLVELTEKNFPEKTSVLAMLNIILIDNYDTAKLSDKQYETLKDWVQKGGTLILSLGANYQNVLHVFTDDFLPGTIEGMEKKDLTWNIYTTQSSMQMDAKFPEATTELTELSDATQPLTFALSGIDTVSLSVLGEEADGFAKDTHIHEKKIGNGKVLLCDYALGMEPIASWESNTVLAQNILHHLANEYPTQDFRGYREEGFSLAELADPANRPSLLVLGLLLGLYICVAGPLLYIVLKKYNKRELIWAILPCSSLVFTGIIYLSSLRFQIKTPLVNTFSLLTQNGSIVQEQIYTNVICPKSKEYELPLNDQISDIVWHPYNDANNIFGVNADESKEYDFLLRTGGGNDTLIIDNNSVFQQLNFLANHSFENTLGEIQADIQGNIHGFEGTITNNTIYDFSNVFVFFENYYYIIEELPKGEQAHIRLEDVYPFYTHYDAFYLYYKGQDVHKDRTKYLNQQIHRMMKSMYIQGNIPQQGGVWAVIPEYKTDLTAANAKIQQYGYAVIYDTFTSSYTDETEVVYPDINEYISAQSGDFDSMDHMMYNDMVELTYTFPEDTKITALVDKNASYLTRPIAGTLSSESFVKVQILNPSTGDFDDIFTDSDVVSASELEPYVKENSFTLRYARETSSEYHGVFLPYIAALGGK